MSEIYLARHGETPFNAERRFQGHLPVPLTERGRAQAAELAEAASAKGFVALYASPLARARETAGIVGARIGLEPREDARFAETDTGHWTGRLFAEVRAEAPGRFDAWASGEEDFAFPGGESFAQQRARVLAGIHDVRAAGHPGPVLIICHRQAMRLVLGGGSLAGHPIDNGALVALPA